MDRHDDPELMRDVDDSALDGGETHATTGGAAAAGAVTGGVIGLTGGPIGAAIGAVTGAIVGAAAERMMHSDDDAERIETLRDDRTIQAQPVDRHGNVDTTTTARSTEVSSTPLRQERVFGERSGNEDDDTER